MWAKCPWDKNPQSNWSKSDKKMAPVSLQQGTNSWLINISYPVRNITIVSCFAGDLDLPFCLWTFRFDDVLTLLSHLFNGSKQNKWTPSTKPPTIWTQNFSKKGNKQNKPQEIVTRTSHAGSWLGTGKTIEIERIWKNAMNT